MTKWIISLTILGITNKRITLFLELVALSQVRVGVDFYEPHSKIFVNHKIIAQKLETRASVPGVQRGFHTQDRVNNQIFDSGDNMILEGNGASYRIQVGLEFLEGQRVAFFKSAEIFHFYLETNIREVDLVL